MKRLSLTAWIFIAMVLGVLVGAIFPEVGKADWMGALSNVFLRLIKSIIAPLIFATLWYALRNQFRFHRSIARWTFPVLLYVSVTGVIVYFVLKSYTA